MKKLIAPLAVAAVAAGVMAAAPAVADEDGSVTIRQSDLIAQLSDTRATGHVKFLDEGLHVWTEGNTSTDKAAEYWAVSGALPTTGSLDWSGTTPDPGVQIVFDADGITGNGNDYNILVGESVYGDNWWLTNGSSADAKAADPSGDDNSGNGSAYFGTLAQWKAALPNATVYAGGFSLGSGIKGDGILRSVSLGEATYDFSKYAENSQVVRKSDLVAELSDTRATGHVKFLKNSLHVWTEGATSTDKAAEYWPASGALPTYGNLDWDGTSPAPGIQVVFDVDNVRGNGNDYNILVGEPAFYGANWWLTNSSSQEAKDADPSGAENGGNGSAYFGTLAQWKAALPNAEVLAGGFSLGSGVKGDGFLRSITLGDTDYTFTNAAAPTEPTVVDVTGTVSVVEKTATKLKLRFKADKLAADTVQGKKLTWVVLVDGKRAARFKQSAGDRDSLTQRFAKGSGKHLVAVSANGTVVKSIKVRSGR